MTEQSASSSSCNSRRGMFIQQQAYEYRGSQSLGQGPASCKLPWRLLSLVTPDSPERDPCGIPIAWEEGCWDCPRSCPEPRGCSAIRLG